MSCLLRWCLEILVTSLCCSLQYRQLQHFISKMMSTEGQRNQRRSKCRDIVFTLGESPWDHKRISKLSESIKPRSSQTARHHQNQNDHKFKQKDAGILTLAESYLLMVSFFCLDHYFSVSARSVLSGWGLNLLNSIDAICAACGGSIFYCIFCKLFHDRSYLRNAASNLGSWAIRHYHIHGSS